MKIKILLAGMAICVLSVINVDRNSQTWEVERAQAVAEETAKLAYEAELKAYGEKKEAWIDNLELCESGGNNSAVNWYDKDGTPSYYAFQFKPGTFRHYAEKYKLIKKGETDARIMELLKVYNLQKEIVEYMVEDPSVRWKNEFPDCVRKYGMPPKNNLIKPNI